MNQPTAVRRVRKTQKQTNEIFIFSFVNFLLKSFKILFNIYINKKNFLLCGLNILLNNIIIMN